MSSDVKTAEEYEELFNIEHRMRKNRERVDKLVHEWIDAIDKKQSSNSKG